MKERPRGRLDDYFFRRNRDVATSGTYVNRREVTITAELSPGYYVIVPSSFNPNEASSFLVRIYTEKKVDLQEL